MIQNIIYLKPGVSVDTIQNLMRRNPLVDYKITVIKQRVEIAIMGLKPDVEMATLTIESNPYIKDYFYRTQRMKLGA